VHFRQYRAGCGDRERARCGRQGPICSLIDVRNCAPRVPRLAGLPTMLVQLIQARACHVSLNKKCDVGPGRSAAEAWLGSPKEEIKP
jgi:hypothetical protein